MTYVELFTEDAIENICACLVSVPDRVILIGSNLKTLRAHAERYHSFFLDRGHDIEFICKSVNKNNLNSIVDLLCSVVEEYEDCVFDLTGGEDLLLVAVGIVFHHYRDMDIQMHRFNLRSNTLYDCDNDGNSIPIEGLPALSVADNIRLYGGKAVSESEKHGATYRWDWTADFIDDIYTMWDVCRRDVRLWNTQLGVFAVAESINKQNEGSLTSQIGISALTAQLRSIGAKYVMIPNIIKSLEDSDLLKIELWDDTLTLTYKNEQIKRCLVKAGQVLEMYITLTAILAEDKDGDPIYNDVRNGVFIDWDGTVEECVDTENEIDVILMHGMIPVFVSCKNGVVSTDELYKLNTVAARFGGKYAKKVLVANALGGNTPYAQHIRQRAQDMNIRIVENVQRMTDKDLSRAIGSLWCN